MANLNSEMKTFKQPDINQNLLLKNKVCKKIKSCKLFSHKDQDIVKYFMSVGTKFGLEEWWTAIKRQIYLYKT